MEIENDPSVEDTHDHSQVSSAAPYYLQSLLPINLPCSKEMLEALHSHARSHDYSYKNALKHLQHGFKSTPAVSEASLLPLIQLLFLGDRIEEATAVLDKACKKSNSVLPLRLRAYVWEVVDANDSGKLSTYFEDVLKKDPTCKYALARLVKFHHKGDYDPEQLVEMLALHLEVTYPDYKTWREFASCLLKLSQCKKTRTSVFISGMSRKTWKVRSKWWLNRHFSKGKLVSEMSAGDLKLITYKAACASHLYGKELEYVTKVNTCLKEHDDKPLLKSLKLHIQNSVGFYSNLTKKRSPIVELRCHTTFSIMY